MNPALFCIKSRKKLNSFDSNQQNNQTCFEPKIVTAKPSRSVGDQLAATSPHVCMNIPCICCVFSCRPLCCPSPLYASVSYNIKTKQMESEAIPRRAENSYHSSSCFILLFRGSWHWCSCLTQRGSYFSSAWGVALHGDTWIYIFTHVPVAHTVHASQKCLVVFGMLVAEISPALSHLRRLMYSSWGSSILHDSPVRLAAEWLDTHTHKQRTGLGGPEATELMFFLKKLSPPSCRCVLNSPLESSFFMTHGHTIAAHWACPLMFARARVHNVHTWQGEAELRGCVMTKCKGRWKCDCFCSSRSHDNIYDLHACVSGLINSCESGHVSCVLQAAHMFSSRNQGRSLKHNSQRHAAAGSHINRISCWKW